MITFYLLICVLAYLFFRVLSNTWRIITNWHHSSCHSSQVTLVQVLPLEYVVRYVNTFSEILSSNGLLLVRGEGRGS